MADTFSLLVVSWGIVGIGLLFYFSPLSIGARRMRAYIVTGICLSLAFLTISASVPMTAGEAYVEIGLPISHGLRVPYRFGWFVLKLWPVFRFVALVVLAVGPVAYIVKNRRESL